MKKMMLGLAIALMSLTACDNHQATQVILRKVDGASINFNELKGKWVVLNYWASWCHPCNEEIPELNAFYQRYKNKNVVVIGVNYDNVTSAELKKIIVQEHISYPNLLSDPRLVLGLGDIPGLPATYIFGPDGTLKDKLFGQQTQESLRQAIHLG